MSIPYAEIGRVSQKQRTRNALLEAARILVLQGFTPTVEEAAAEAGISRTTAYRYFANQRELLAAAYPDIAAPSLLGPNPPRDVAKRLEVVVSELIRMTIEMEPALRAMLRLSLDADPADRERLHLRRGRAIRWLKQALEPLRDRIPDQSVQRLVYAIRTAVGIEALVWLCDVGGLSRERAAEVMEWSAGALLRAALVEGQLPGGKRLSG